MPVIGRIIRKLKKEDILIGTGLARLSCSLYEIYEIMEIMKPCVDNQYKE